MIFNYKLHNDISISEEYIDDMCLETSTLKYYNGIAGIDLDTITQIISSDSSAPIYIYDKSGNIKVNDTSAFDFSKITAGYNQSINSYSDLSTDIYRTKSKYMRFSGDNMSTSGQESVFINMYALTKDNDFISKCITKLYCNLYGQWHIQRYTGKIDVIYKTYKTDDNIIDYNKITCEDYIINTTDIPLETQEYKSIIVSDVYNNGATLSSGEYTLLAKLTYDIKTGSATLSKIQQHGKGAYSLLLYNHNLYNSPNSSNGIYVLSTYTCPSTLNTTEISFSKFAYQKFNPTNGTLDDFIIADNQVWTLDDNKYGDNTKLNATLRYNNQVTINVKRTPGIYMLYCRPLNITFPDVSQVVTKIKIT